MPLQYEMTKWKTTLMLLHRTNNTIAMKDERVVYVGVVLVDTKLVFDCEKCVSDARQQKHNNYTHWISSSRWNYPRWMHTIIQVECRDDSRSTHFKAKLNSMLWLKMCRVAIKCIVIFTNKWLFSSIFRSLKNRLQTNTLALSPHYNDLHYTHIIE